MTLTIENVVLFAVLLVVGSGIYGLLITRNLIKVVVALQILVKGVLLALVLAGYTQGKVNLSQNMAVTVIVADTIVAVIGLAIAVQVRKAFSTLDLRSMTNLKG